MDLANLRAVLADEDFAFDLMSTQSAEEVRRKFQAKGFDLSISEIVETGYEIDKYMTGLKPFRTDTDELSENEFSVASESCPALIAAALIDMSTASIVGTVAWQGVSENGSW